MAMVSLPSDAALAALRAACPDDLVSFDRELFGTYGRDWTRVYEPAPCAVALPRTTAEVASLVRFCAANEIAVVPSGGRTGLAGGAECPAQTTSVTTR